MGLLRSEVMSRGFWDQGPLMARNRLNVRGKAVATLAVLAAGFGIFSDEGLGGWGHFTTERTNASMNKEALAKYAIALQQASPSQLFALRYTDFAQVSVARAAKGHSGIMGFIETSDIEDNPVRDYTIGDGCLNDTAYDINGGQLHFNVRYSGFFSSVDANATGDVPTAAAQAIYNPPTHELTIKTGSARPDDLHFDVEGDSLKPLDQTTINILGTYGCKPEPHYSHENAQ